MSRPSVLTEPGVSKNGARAEKVELEGYAYLASYHPRGLRVYVPGYSEDFLVTNMGGLNPISLLNEWIQFNVFAETKEYSPEDPMTMAKEPIVTRRGTVVLLCEKKEGIVKTVKEGHVVTDPGNELGSRRLPENFRMELTLQLKNGHPNKPVFVVDEFQPSLPKRVAPREPVKAQNPQNHGYSMRQNHGRNQYQNSANNSDLPRYLRPQTNRDSRPRPVFYNVNSNGYHNQPQHQHTPPPPPFENNRPRGNENGFSSGRSSASSAEYHTSPRTFPESTSSRYLSSSNSSERSYTARMQLSQAEKDKEIADILRNEMKNAQFKEMLRANFPDFFSKLQAYM